MDNIREEIEAMYPEWVILVIMPDKNEEGKIKGQPIIEIEAKTEIWIPIYTYIQRKNPDKKEKIKISYV